MKEKLVDKKQKRDQKWTDGETFEDAPVWWQLEVEGHSFNRRNKNRVRQYLRRCSTI